MEQLLQTRCFNGTQFRFRHDSPLLQCAMTFSLYLPDTATADNPVPCVYWLSGLTCNDENFTTKAGAQRIASELGLALVVPDMSPRGNHVADDPGYDLGQGAGFYVNATQPPWSAHYKMFDYISDELPHLIEGHFPISQQRALSGHSMGGHGALVIGLRQPSRYSSISAFSPICAPSACQWGQKAFTHYFGRDDELWRTYDAAALIANTTARVPILIDQGEDDEFLHTQLLPDNLLQAAANYPMLTFNSRPGYDHSYFFVCSFIDTHLQFHAACFRRDRETE
uniref:S-formylglutathione hydrolase n=1 Tax=Thaumasiovibrio occultus TaxID=1891184 RepID=UPI000B361A59|nr:S-formylglutathione hydrolase [Thaumasiovibrio occultus]